MSIFNILGEVSKVIGERTGEFVESSRMSNQLKEERLELEKLYAALGKHVRARSKGTYNGEADQISQTYFAEIDRKVSLIERLETEQIAVNNAAQKSPHSTKSDQKFCTSCGTSNTIQARFCEECGGSIELVEDNVDKYPDVCQNIETEWNEDISTLKHENMHELQTDTLSEGLVNENER